MDETNISKGQQHPKKKTSLMLWIILNVWIPSPFLMGTLSRRIFVLYIYYQIETINLFGKVKREILPFMDCLAYDTCYPINYQYFRDDSADEKAQQNMPRPKRHFETRTNQGKIPSIELSAECANETCICSNGSWFNLQWHTVTYYSNHQIATQHIYIYIQYIYISQHFKLEAQGQCQLKFW